MKRTCALLLALGAIATADTVVLRDRTILAGSVGKRGQTLSVGEKTVKLADVLLWEDDEGIAQYSAGFSDRYGGYVALGQRALLRACRERFPEAIQAGAKEAAGEILASAVAVGLAAEEAVAWGATLAKTGAKKGATVKVPGDGVLARLFAQRAQSALDAGDEYRGWRILRAALRWDRDDEEALAILDEIAPARWKIGHFKEEDDDEYRVQRLWLNWQVDVLRGEVRAIGRLHPDMQRARAFWRKDLNGLETREEGAEIVFITPLNQRTEVVGKCVRYAKITCRALAKMFRTDQPQREDSMPLVIYFYESKNEYVRLGSGTPNPFLAMTAGYYTPNENISRFFWPAQRPDAATAVRDTFVHELTHHWIERRNPRWHARDLASMGDRVQVPGYWIGEGFATFIEEGRYDIDAYTWTHFNPKANSIDIVAGLSQAKKLIDWKKLYTLSQSEFHGEGLEKKGVFATAKKRWGMRPQPLNEIRLFYEQAATTCHFLYWGEGGKYRDRLLDYVTAFYTSKKEKTDIQTAFGLSEKELGQKVEAWARQVIYEGWRPKGA